jgi:hypothetical protein
MISAACKGMRFLLVPLFTLFALWQTAYGLGEKPCVRFKGGGFRLSVNGTSSPLCASTGDYAGVLRVLKLLRTDIGAVTGSSPDLALDTIPALREIVLVGTLGKSPLVDQLVRERKIDVRGVTGQWESFLIQTVPKPFSGVDRALVIAGSDKRGTIYGMFTLSQQIGVSPWYWWADVPVKRHKQLFILPGRYTEGPPSVKYRGIFLNDEFPALTKWVHAKFGDVTPSSTPPVPPDVANYGHEFYERIFEVLLRLKANYLWPAMWNNAFNEDDQVNPVLADEYGIVMGTSHQEPMLRAQKEWDRRYKGTLGSWNYAKHPDTLERFWREGIRRNKNFESIVTMGLRGADDTPMAPGGPGENMALLEKIIGVQRNILAEEMNSDAAKVPQVWCLYKEVLEFYKAGMRVPDDVTLLWPDDNWGNLRRLPTAEERKRSGGAGIYYHFDYHGSPRSYQWVNTNPISKIWEQMSLAKANGADRIWIVNVGHFKGYELPLEYFMDLAWDSARLTNDNINEYTSQWAEREFGPTHARVIADILMKYTKYNGRRKPELLTPTTYSLVNYHEAEKVVAGFREISSRTEELYGLTAPESKNAFYELVLFPTKASALVNEIYFAAGRNALYAKQGRSGTNELAEETRRLFAADTALMGYFNHTLANGKWDHFMDQAHLGYTNWADPPENSLRAIPLSEIEVPVPASMGVAVEGMEAAWPDTQGTLTLPEFDSYNDLHRSIEIFNRGRTSFPYAVTSDKPWIHVSAPSGTVDKQSEIWTSIDWSKVPAGRSKGTVFINGAGQKTSIGVKVFHPTVIIPKTLKGFVETNGHVSIEAEHFTKNEDIGTNRWIMVQDYGHTLSAMRATSGTVQKSLVPGEDSPCLEYQMYLFHTGDVVVDGTFGPTLNFVPGRGLRYAVSFDEETPQLATLVPQEFIAQHGNMDWEKTVADNARRARTHHPIARAGYHTLKIWMIDPGVVLEKIVVDCGGVRPSYLGPPESYHQSRIIE